jgi:hypothetical protein
MTYQFGNVLHPAFEDRLIPDAQNGAWDDLGPRVPLGVVRHTMVGSLAGTDLWFRRGAASTGLTDYGVGKDGTIYRWNDPTGAAHPNVSANRAGWANGGSDGLEGDGPLFVRTLGVNAINRNLVSIERDDQGQPFDNPYVDPQALLVDRLIAHWFDRAKVPWDRYPINPNVGGGIVTDFFHNEFATKGCPWGPVEAAINASQDRVRGFLKAAQVNDGIDVPVQPPIPVEPDHNALPMNYTEAGLKARFGRMTRRNANGSTSTSGFSMKGAISNAWIARGAAEKRTMAELPPASYMAETENPKLLIDGKPATAAIVLFDGRGADNWVLWRPDPSIAWRWLI